MTVRAVGRTKSYADSDLAHKKTLWDTSEGNSAVSLEYRHGARVGPFAVRRGHETGRRYGYSVRGWAARRLTIWTDGEANLGRVADGGVKDRIVNLRGALDHLSHATRAADASAA